MEGEEVYEGGFEVVGFLGVDEVGAGGVVFAEEEFVGCGYEDSSFSLAALEEYPGTCMVWCDVIYDVFRCITFE